MKENVEISLASKLEKSCALQWFLLSHICFYERMGVLELKIMRNIQWIPYFLLRNDVSAKFIAFGDIL